jgi:hypothetical protein
MCDICKMETVITDKDEAHEYVMGIIRRSMRLEFSIPFMFGGCLHVFSNITDQLYSLNTWSGLSAFLDSVEGD